MNIDNIKHINELCEKKEELEEELANIKDEIAQVRSECNHIPVKVSNLQIENLRYCLLCRKRVTRQKAYRIDAHNYKVEKYGDGFTEKQRQGRLKDLQNIALKIYEKNENIDNQEMCKEIKRAIEESNMEFERNKVIKKVLGEWVNIWMSKR